jgi:glycopeptide antibiotics resistance protein
VAALWVAAVSWAFAIAAFSFFPFPLPPYSPSTTAGRPFEHPPNLWLSQVPFHTISKATAGSGTNLAYAIGNVAAYVPLGVLVWLLRPGARILHAVAAGMLISGSVELLQLAISLAVGFPFRVADIDDVLLNVLGTVLGYLVVRGLATARSRARTPAISVRG